MDQRTNTGVRPASRLSGLAPYAPPACDSRITLRLDANEGTPTGAAVARGLASVDAESLRRYPDASSLEGALAERLSIAPERVVVTNGADDAIDRACRAVLEPGRELVLHTPTFEMIERSARLSGASVRGIPWLDVGFPTDALLGAIGEATGLVALVSPNNPTGAAIPLGDLLNVARSARRVGALVLVDLAYVEFADVDPTDTLIDEPNVVVVRTFSKAMGLAGARVGYAIGSTEVAGWIRTVGGPYPVSSVSLALAGASLLEPSEQVFIERVRHERGRLRALLEDRGIRVLPSEANFVLVRCQDPLTVQESLAEFGIGVRSFGARPELADWLRISLPGEPASFDRLVAACRSVLPARAKAVTS